MLQTEFYVHHSNDIMIYDVVYDMLKKIFPLNNESYGDSNSFVSIHKTHGVLYYLSFDPTHVTVSVYTQLPTTRS